MSQWIELVRDLAKRASFDAGLIETRIVGISGTLRVFISISGRIGAAIDSSGVFLKRSMGRSGALNVSWTTLVAMEVARQHWTLNRDSWAVFESSSSGHVMGCSSYVRAPGAGSEYVTIGSSVMGRSRGKSFTGVEEERIPSHPWSADGVKVIREFWRVGEEQTPPEGWQVGLVYELPDGCRIEAHRSSLDIFHGTETAVIEEFDDKIIPLLLNIGAQSGYVQVRSEISA
jgi:hypothetical protein